MTDQVQTGCLFNVKDSLLYNYPDVYSESNFSIKDNYWNIDDYICTYRKPQDYQQDDPVAELPSYRNIRILLVYLLDSNIDNFIANITSLANSNISPVFLSIVAQHDLPHEYISKCIRLLENDFYGIIFPWKFHRLHKDIGYDQSVDLALTNTARKKSSRFYSVWSNDKLIPDQYFTLANSAILDLITKRPVVKPFVDNIGQVIPFYLYSHEKNVNSHMLTMHNLFVDNQFPEYYQTQIETND